MKFIVTRTSRWRTGNEDLPPCEGAVLEPFVTPWGNDVMLWTLELTDLDALMQFVKTHGSVILEYENLHSHGSGLLELEIYDDYRE